MKKYFLLSVAALGLMFGCQKKEYSTPNGNQSINDNSPALVKLSIDVPKAVIPITKGAGHGSVDQWGKQDLTLLAYAIDAEEKDGKVVYDWSDPENSLFPAPIETVAPDSEWGPKEVEVEYETFDQQTNQDVLSPVYYKDDRAYDFFGFYLDNLAEGVKQNEYEKLEMKPDGVFVDLEIDGTQDIMAGKTNVAQDIAAASMTGDIDPADVYSAFSARRKVVPCVRFEHMLSRFNFYVVAASQSAADIVNVKEITIKAPYKGTLQVAGKGRETFTPSFTDIAKDEGDLKEFVLCNAAANGVLSETAQKVPYAGFLADIEAFKNAPDMVLEAPHADQARIGSSVMVMPNQGAHDIVVKTENTRYTKLPIPDLELTLKAEDIKTPDGNPIASFAPGYQYDVILMIYGPEQVKVSVYLSEWKDGGYYSHDPETDNLIEPTQPKATLLSATASTLTFEVKSPDAIASLYAVLRDPETNNDLTAYLPVVPTRAWKNTVTFDKLTTGDPLETGKEYLCVLAYLKDGVYTECTETVLAVPSDVTARGAVHVFDLDSYIAIPSAYRAADSYNGIDKYLALYFDAVSDAKVTVKHNGTATLIENVSVSSDVTMLKYAASDLFTGATELKPGKYELILTKNGSSSAQTVVILDPEFKIEKCYVVSDKASYESLLPVFYQKNNPFDGNKMPWIVVETTDYDNPLVTAKRGTEVIEVVGVTLNEYNMIILDKETLGVDDMKGIWTIEVNNVEAPNTVEVER